MSEDPISSGSVDPKRQLEEMREYVKAIRRDFEQERKEVNDQLDEIREENYRLRHELEQVRKEVAEVKKATDLLRVVKENDKPRAEQAKSALILSLKKKAESRAERNGKRPVASFDREEAQHVLNHPDVHRTTINKWMQRAAEMIDGNLLQYDNGRLKINLQVGDVPDALVTDVTEEIDD